MDRMDLYGILITLFFVIVGLFYPFCYSVLSDPENIPLYAGALTLSVFIGLLYVGLIAKAFGKMAKEKQQSN